jgi:hypothetical protein
LIPLLCLSTTPLLGGCKTFCAIFCPASKPLLAELDWSTPERAVNTYRRAFRAENPEYEYRCLSNHLKEEHPISLTEYSLGRDRFLAQNQELVDLFLEAESEPPRPMPGSDPPQVVIRLKKGSHFADFRLVNEPVVWIRWFDRETGDIIPVEVPLASLDSHIRIRDRRMTAQWDVPDGQEVPPVEAIQKITVTDRWRLMDIVGLSSSLKKAIKDYESQ